MPKIYKIITILLVTTLVATGAVYSLPYINRWINFSFCEEPITYSVGSINPNFDISKQELIELSKEGAEIWNDIMNFELFVYNSNGDTKINMVYDRRQELLNKVKDNKEDLDYMRAQIELKEEKFKNEKAQLEQEVNSLNNEIDNWNSKGGAPKEVYDDLINKQKEINEQIQNINRAADELNNETDTLNTEVEKANDFVEKFNNLIKETPEEGIYRANENEIDIYIYSSEQNLRYTIAHELGHVLGLDHIDKENALMATKSSETTKVTEEDIELIKNHCARQNRLDLIKNDIKNYFY